MWFYIVGEDNLKHRRNGKDFLAILWLFTYSSWVSHVSFYVSNNASTSTQFEVELLFFIMLVVRLLSLIFEIQWDTKFTGIDLCLSAFY